MIPHSLHNKEYFLKLWWKISHIFLLFSLFFSSFNRKYLNNNKKIDMVSIFALNSSWKYSKKGKHYSLAYNIFSCFRKPLLQYTSTHLMQWSGNPLFWSHFQGSLHLDNEIHSKVVVSITLWNWILVFWEWIPQFLSVDYHSKTKWSLIWLLNEWISTLAHLRSRGSYS